MIDAVMVSIAFGRSTNTPTGVSYFHSMIFSMSRKPQETLKKTVEEHMTSQKPKPKESVISFYMLAVY